MIDAYAARMKIDVSTLQAGLVLINGVLTSVQKIDLSINYESGEVKATIVCFPDIVPVSDAEPAST